MKGDSVVVRAARSEYRLRSSAMARNRPSRRLLAGPLAYHWRTGHRHELVEDQEGHARHDDCREVLTLRQAGAPGRLVIVFHRGPGRLVSDGWLHAGAVMRASDHAYLNLHRPKVVRALLDEALERGHDFTAPGSVEVDGWGLFDGVLGRLHPSEG